MKKIALYSSATVILIVAVYLIFFREKTIKIEAKTVQVTRSSITNQVTATGTVEPVNQVEVGTQVSGVIEKIYVDYNSTVKAGQLIAQLDKTTLLATVNETTAALNTALNEQEYRQKNYDRIHKLHDSKVVSDTDYEEALYNLNNAKGVTEQRKSDLTRAKTNLSYASIYSPIDGVVISKSVEEGQTVAASYSTPTLFTIAQDLKQMQVEANVDEADIGQVKEGQRVSFTVDAYPNDEFSGTVSQVRLEPIEESNVITYTVIIDASNADGKLKPGLTASISIFTFELNNVLTVETQALNFKADPKQLDEYLKQNNLSSEFLKDFQFVDTDSTKTVWVKDSLSISPVQVEIGATDGVITEVKSGLSAGQKVVYSLESISSEIASETTGGSPFMPKPPSRSSKK